MLCKSGKLSVTAFISISLLIACSKKDESERDDNQTDYTVASNSVASDSELSAEAASLVITDALETMADSNESTTAASSLALRSTTREVASNDSWVKTCKTSGDDAEVKLEGKIDRKVTVTAVKASLERTTTGSSTVTRKFSKDSGSVTCVDSKRANIDWLSDLTGYNLVVNIDREAESDVTITNKIKNTTRSFAKSFSVDGERTINWTAHSEDAGAGTFTRTKTVSSKMTREHKRANSEGNERTLNFTVQTTEDAPLTVVVVRNASDGALISKTLESGSIEAVRKDDAKVVTTYKDLKLEFSSSACNYASGSASIAIYKEGESDATSNYTFNVISEGSYTLTNDKTGETVTDFEVEECALADFKQ